MKKILFACDLDNTLIYSYKHRREGDLCIELLKEKEQGFISEQSAELLRRVFDRVLFLPITTRSVEQYLRIKWPFGCAPQYAVTTNSGILLDGGASDPEWLSESLLLSADYKDELERMYLLLKDDEKFIRCRMVDELYLFTYTKDGVNIHEPEKTYKSSTTLNVVASGRKLYFFPPRFNKGEALRRFLTRYNADLILSAGDSVIDTPMLSLAHHAFIPNGTLAPMCNGAKLHIAPSGVRFSDYLLSEILRITDEYC